ncbi:hypothetical protein [Pseudomonas inefficax]|uniref:hypothetical protein n=1 Tax=Pseudomonas inefficax TaxID=2078786 RepID=UPI004046BDA3
MSSDRATEKELAVVHNEFATWCLEIMRGVPVTIDGEGVMEDGKLVRSPPAPAYLNVIRQFLKDNKIESLASKGTTMGDLSDLPVFDDDNVIELRKH